VGRLRDRHGDEDARARLRWPTDRELDVPACLGRGLSNADIARELSLAEATVKSYVSRMLVKIDCRNRTQAGLLAHEAGLVSSRRSSGPGTGARPG
jgi:DNA-binding NarL/FixJ family response regulator